jgi:hypothetical protein
MFFLGVKKHNFFINIAFKWSEEKNLLRQSNTPCNKAKAKNILLQAYVSGNTLKAIGLDDSTLL